MERGGGAARYCVCGGVHRCIAKHTFGTKCSDGELGGASLGKLPASLSDCWGGMGEGVQTVAGLLM